MTNGTANGVTASDLATFTELVARHQAMAFGYALAILRDVDSAQDATQEAFVAAYFGLGSLADRDKFPQWLRGIVRHQCWRLLRRRELATAPLESASAIVAPGITPEQWCVEQEATERIIAALAGLPEHLRPIATLFYLHERPQREIATTLKLPKTTVNNRLHEARLLLRDWRATMTIERSDDASTHFGTIVQIRGQLVEARFATAALPHVLTTLAVGPGASGPTIGVSKVQPDGLIHGLLLDENPRVGGLTTGARLIDTGKPIDRPASAGAVRALIANMRRDQQAAAPIETGIKALDLLYPVARGGTLGIFGDMGVGKMVVLAELVRNTAGHGAGFARFVFVQVGEEAAFLHSLDDEHSPAESGNRASYVVVDQPTILQPGGAAAELETTIYLTREQALRGFYPAIDFARSASTLLDPAIVGAEHYRVAQEVLALLTRYPEDTLERDTPSARARRLRRFLSQAFFVAAPYTKVPGEFVPLAATIAGCAAIIRGEYDQIDERAFIRIGAIEQVHNYSPAR